MTASKPPRWLTPTVAAALTLLAVACGDGTTEPEPPSNRAPTALGSIPAQDITIGESVTVNVASAFSDPDGNPLTFSAVSSMPAVAIVAVSGATVTITAISAGTAVATVTATDPGGTLRLAEHRRDRGQPATRPAGFDPRRDDVPG